MRIAMVGLGGVGAYFGTLLAEAGEDVVGIARGTHLAAIRSEGLKLEGPRGNHFARIEVSDDGARLGQADIVVFGIKHHQIEGVATAAAPLFGPHTIGISLLNGIDGAARLTQAIRGATVVDGSAYVSAAISSPGHVRYNGDLNSIIFGAPGNAEMRGSGSAFVSACRSAGFEADMVDDATGPLWNKLIGLSTFSALTTAARLPAGPLFADPDVMELVAALIHETTTVARAVGADLPDNVETIWMERFKRFPEDLYASMYYDLVDGAPLEVESLSGYVVREGRRQGVAVPHHAALHAVLKLHATGSGAARAKRDATQAQS